MEKIIRFKDVAKLIGISSSTLQFYKYKGIIPKPIYISNPIFHRGLWAVYSKKDVMKYIKRIKKIREVLKEIHSLTIATEKIKI